MQFLLSTECSILQNANKFGPFSCSKCIQEFYIYVCPNIAKKPFFNGYAFFLLFLFCRL